MKRQTRLALALWSVVVLGLASNARADSWDEVLAAARKEGSVVAVLGGSASRNYRPIFKHFEGKFGIRTVVSTGGGSKQADRLLAERRAGKSEVDVIMAGGTAVVTRLVPNRALDPIAPAVFLPAVVNPSHWLKGWHLYSDQEEKFDLPV